MGEILSENNLLNIFMKEHTYRLSQTSTGNSNITSLPMRNFLDVSVLGGWRSTAFPGGLGPSTGSHLEVTGQMLGLGLLQKAGTLGNKDPLPRREDTLLLNSQSVVTEPSITRWQVNIHFCVKDVSLV